MLLFGEDRLVANWVASRIQVTPFREDATAIGVVRGDHLIGGVVYTNFRRNTGGNNIEMGCAGEGNWLTKGALRVFFAYPFEQLDCCRVTTLVAKKNKRARRFNDKLGFKLEGVVRRGFGHDDACVYGMLIHECRWIGKGANELRKRQLAAACA